VASSIVPAERSVDRLGVESRGIPPRTARKQTTTVDRIRPASGSPPASAETLSSRECRKEAETVDERGLGETERGDDGRSVSFER